MTIRLLPLLSAMYLFNAIDRSNLGNAKTDGLEEDLHMKGNEYSITLVLFYVTFCLLDVPANMLLKKFSGKIMLPTLMMGWGSMTLIQCAVHNWGGLIACRLLMGAFEAGFMAGMYNAAPKVSAVSYWLNFHLSRRGILPDHLLQT